jgi:hypothetical protein
MKYKFSPLKTRGPMQAFGEGIKAAIGKILPAATVSTATALVTCKAAQQVCADGRISGHDENIVRLAGVLTGSSGGVAVTGLSMLVMGAALSRHDITPQQSWAHNHSIGKKFALAAVLATAAAGAAGGCEHADKWAASFKTDMSDVQNMPSRRFP